MDFNRGGQIRLNNATPTPAAKPAAASASSGGGLHLKKGFKDGKLVHWSFIALLLSGTILAVAVIFFIAFGVPVNREAKYVDKDQYQAVFVNVNGTNGGQVYFGRIAALTPQYIRLVNVFYIQNQQSDSASTNGAYNLVKLGCELHGPADEMLINRSEVFFWENLKTDSQVAKKAAEFYKQNPNGQKCDNSSSTQQTTQTPAETDTTKSGTGTTGTSTTGTDKATTPATTKQ